MAESAVNQVVIARMCKRQQIDGLGWVLKERIISSASASGLINVGDRQPKCQAWILPSKERHRRAYRRRPTVHLIGHTIGARNAVRGNVRRIGISDLQVEAGKLIASTKE